MDTASALPPDTLERPIARPGRRLAQGLRLNSMFGLAIVIAFGMSLQFLAQLFVWRNWPVSEVLEGWLFIFRDRLIVAVLIALAVAGLRAQRVRSLRLRSALLAACVLCGAMLGEAIVRSLYGSPADPASVFTRSLYWSAVAFAAAGSYYLWSSAAAARARLQREALLRQQLEQQLTKVRLTALHKQIEPHFLFNTLATVRRLQRVQPADGAYMLANFVDYMRGLLPMLSCAEVSLAQELNLVQAYLAVIHVRMAERLQIQVEVPEALRGALVPPLTLATLVENAVKHGLAPSPRGGRLEISAKVYADTLEISVADTGVGLRPEVQGGSGIGLYNVRTRLATLHGHRASLRIQANRPTGVRATIRLPLQRSEP
jgi:signal transduction histidine kinase